MAIQLTPRNYKQNLSWKMLTKNKLDTLTSKPYVNDQLSATVVHSEEITSVDIGGTTYQLPLSNNVAPTHSGSSYNNDGTANLAIGEVQAVVVSGTFTLQLTTPLPTAPTVKLRFEGETKYINRRLKTFSQMESLFWGQSNIAPNIAANASGTESWTDSKSSDSYNRSTVLIDDPTLVDYNKPSVPLYPFVKVIRSAGEGINGFNANKLTPNEVLTSWVMRDQSYYGPKTDGWSGRNNTNAWLSWDDMIWTSSPTISVNEQRARFVKKTIPITTEVIKINDYEYTINWSAPIRYAYEAASQAYEAPFGIRSYHLTDSYAFLDVASKIIVDVTAQEMNTDTVDMSYSIVNGDITDEIINNYPLSFEANEFITLQTYIGVMSNRWTYQAATWILKEYEHGKYIVECDVYARWAIDNDIHVNTEIQVMLQDGTYITRNGDIVTFEVKTIEKSFKGNEFIYSLRMLEV